MAQYETARDASDAEDRPGRRKPAKTGMHAAHAVSGAGIRQMALHPASSTWTVQDDDQQPDVIRAHGVTFGPEGTPSSTKFSVNAYPLELVRIIAYRNQLAGLSAAHLFAAFGTVALCSIDDWQCWTRVHDQQHYGHDASAGCRRRDGEQQKRNIATVGWKEICGKLA
jgi:hypothetical protein